jgi:hypothetical protein
LCSNRNVTRARADARRVLNPAVQFLFLEHGAHLMPTYAAGRIGSRDVERVAGGFHLNALSELLTGAACPSEAVMLFGGEAAISFVVRPLRASSPAA